MPDKISPADGPVIAAVIPTYNVALWLPAFLRWLEQQTAEIGLVELVFVDYGATDGSAALNEQWAEA